MEQNILFLCSGNSAQSQMAEALLTKHEGDVFQVYSAGTEPKDQIYPPAIEAIKEIGIDISNKPEQLARFATAMSSLVRMYRPHAAREDTVVFPAWKQVLTAEQLNEMNEKFEEIEHEMFGEDGFENAVRQIDDIEKEYGLSDLSLFTAPSIAG